MKKLVKILAAAIVICSSSSAVTSCKEKDNGNYVTFKTWINEKKSFVLMIGANDNNDTIHMQNSFYNTIINNPDDPLNNLSTWSSWNNYSGSSPKEFSKNNVTPKEMNGTKTSDLWGENWSKNILSWAAVQSANKQGMSLDPSFKKNFEKKFNTSTPLFIFIYKGEYMGIKSGAPKDSSSKPSISWKLFFTFTDEILISNHYPDSDDFGL